MPGRCMNGEHGADDAGQYPAVDLTLLPDIVATHFSSPADLIPTLQRVQGCYGYLPEAVVREIARLTGLPAARIYGVITFYAQFSTEPSGRHKVCVCQGTACHVRGSRDVLRAVEDTLGIKAGETAEDLSFTLETAACLGACSLAPVVTVDGQYYGKLTAAKVVAPLEQVARGEDDDGD